MIFPIQTNLVRTLSRRTLLASALLVLPLLSFNAWAQAPARLMGTITAINGKAISVKPDTGDAKSRRRSKRYRY